MRERPGRAAAASAAVLFAALSLMAIWSFRNPLPQDWDEANYVLQVHADAAFLQSGGVLRLLKAFVFEDVQRPPAYRILALVPAVVAGVSVPMLRLVGYAGFLVTAWLLWVAARRWSGSEVAAALTVGAFATAPGVISGFRAFGTEYPLFVAVALLLVAPFCQPRVDAGATAAAVALGLLSKTSFVLLAVPFLAGRLLPRGRRAGILLASAAGGLVALPWWRWNAGHALEYADWGRRFPRLAIGTGSRWASGGANWLFGTIGLLAAIALLAAIRRRERSPLLGAFAAASLVLPLLALASPFVFPRHVAPALLPLLVLAAYYARPRWLSGVLIAAQLLFIAIPPLGQTRYAPVRAPLQATSGVDWTLLRRFGPANPVISFYGLAPALTPPELRYAWVKAGADARVVWLWRMEEGPQNWPDIVQMAAESDIVLLPDVSSLDPRPMGPLEADFRLHNAELARFEDILRSSPNFGVPTRVAVGRADQRYEVLVYVNRARGRDARALELLLRKQQERIRRTVAG